MAKFHSEQSNKSNEVAVAQVTPVSANEPSGQIVEAIDSESHAGQTVVDAAPVQTVSSDELESPQPIQVADNTPPQKMQLIKEAVAEEPVEAPAADEPAANEEQVDTTVKINPNETITETAPAPTEPAEKPVAPKPTRKIQKAEPAETAPVEASTSAGGNYIIRAGAFASEENAQKLVARLEGTKAIINRIETGGKVWWRVHVGPFQDKALADSVLAKVHKSGAPDARVARQ